MATNKTEFIPSLTHGDEAVREYARQLLGIVGEENVPAFLSGLLASGTPDERQAAAQALGETGGHRAFRRAPAGLRERRRPRRQGGGGAGLGAVRRPLGSGAAPAGDARPRRGRAGRGGGRIGATGPSVPGEQLLPGLGGRQRRGAAGSGPRPRALAVAGGRSLPVGLACPTRTSACGWSAPGC